MPKFGCETAKSFAALTSEFDADISENRSPHGAVPFTNSLNSLTVYPQGKYLDVIEDRISGLNLKRKVRSDAVYMCSFVLTASPEFFKVATPDKQQRFFHDFTNFFKDKYGEENVLSAIVHLDETKLFIEGVKFFSYIKTVAPQSSKFF